MQRDLHPRLKDGRASHGKAWAASLLALLISPTVAALIVLTVAAGATPAVYGATMYFYVGYAVGLVCFIVLNRRFRRLGGG